jgi:L-ribulose-5-phosphate 4-epimerase
MSAYQSIKEECCEANIALPKTGLVDLTFGNVSVADPENRVFAIKPSGVPYEKLTPDAVPVLDFEGNILEGKLRPSSDTPTHCCLFLEFEGIRSVVHTHSRNAVAFAQAGRDLPCLGTTHCDYFHGDIPVTRQLTEAEVEVDYEWETGKVIVERFKKGGLDPLAMSAVLTRNHGPFAWGVTGKKAVENAFVLEIVADMAIKTLALNSEAARCPQYLLDKHYYRKHGADAYYGQH